jgi:hypothetical protein
MRHFRKSLETDDEWSVEDMDEAPAASHGFNLDEVRRCAAALENRLAGADGEVAEKVLEEILPRLGRR